MLRLIAATLLTLAACPTFAQTADPTTAEAPTAAEAAAAAPNSEAPTITVSDFELNTSQDLIDLCALGEDHPDFEVAHSFCIGFVTGVLHYHSAIARAPGMGPITCPNRPIPRDMLINSFLQWSAAHPEQARNAPVGTVIKAAAAEWPCNR